MENKDCTKWQEIKERRDALLQAMDESTPEGSVREVIPIKDDRGEVIMRVTRWRNPTKVSQMEMCERTNHA